MTKPDFATMTGPQLVTIWNEMVLTAIDLGSDKYKTVQRFATAEAGVKRCEALHSSIVAMRAGLARVEDEKDLRPTELREKDAQVEAVPGEADHFRVKGTEPIDPPADAGSQSEASSDVVPADDSEDDDMAKKRKAAAKAKKVASPRKSRGDGPTLASYTEEWNALVPRAVKAGIKGVKHHSSDFETHVKAKARLAWLNKELAKA